MLLASILAASWVVTTGETQAIPPPRDGDIRALYWELQDRTQVWLTLELRSPEGKPLPTGMSLTFSLEFPGKRPKARPEQIEIRANAGFLWAPRIEFWVLLDDREKINLAPSGMVSLVTGGAWDYLPAMVSIDTLARMTQAKNITGNALGLDFVLGESQLIAIRTFYGRVLSDNPAEIVKRHNHGGS